MLDEQASNKKINELSNMLKILNFVCIIKKLKMLNFLYVIRPSIFFRLHKIKYTDFVKIHKVYIKYISKIENYRKGGKAQTMVLYTQNTK